LRCTPYATLGQLWRAGTRNLCPVFFGTPALLILVAAALAGLYVAPPILLAVRAAHADATMWLPLVEVRLGLMPRVLADRRAGYPLWVTLLHPLAAASYAAMAMAAAFLAWRGGTVEWRGRRYPVSNQAA